MSLQRLVLLLVFVVVGFASSLAVAQVKNKEKARMHYESAEKYYQKAEFRKALEDYLKVLDYIETDSIPEMYFNIAQCHRQLGEIDKALFYYRLFLSKSPTSPLRPEVEKHITAMEMERKKTTKPKGKVTIITEPPGATILLDTFEGEGIGQTPKVIEAEEGTHILVLRLAGYKDLTHQLVVEPDKMVVVQQTLTSSSGSSAPTHQDPKSFLVPPGQQKPVPSTTPVPEQPKPVVPQSQPFYTTWWFWTGTGATTVFTLATVGFGIRTLNLHDDWKKSSYTDTDAKDQGELSRTLTDVFLVGALVSAGLTVWGVLTHNSTPPATTQNQNVWLVPSCGPTGCGLVFSLSF